MLYFQQINTYQSNNEKPLDMKETDIYHKNINNLCCHNVGEKGTFSFVVSGNAD